MFRTRFMSVIFCICIVFSQTVEAAVFNFAPKNIKTTEVIKPVMPSSGQYPIGEQLNYQIHWMGIPVGYGKITLDQQKQNRIMSAEVIAVSNDFLSSFFPVEDTLISKFSEDGYSHSFTKNVREGRYTAHEVLEFDYDKNTARYRSVTNGSVKNYDIDGNIHDVISAFYWVRNQPMNLGDSLSTSVFNDEKVWDLNFHIKEVKTIRLPDHEPVESILIEPEAFVEDRKMGKGKVRIYISNDEKRIPLRVDLKTPFGSVRTYLTDTQTDSAPDQ